MAKKHKHEEHENHERWLVSYADFITLLFAFFVVMYSVSSVNEGKFRTVSSSLKAALNPIVSPLRTATPFNVGGAKKNALVEAGKKEEEPVYKRIRKAIKRLPSGTKLASKASISEDGRGIAIVIQDDVLFKPGQAVVLPEALPFLEALGEVLHDFEPLVQVEGHTDNVPIRSEQFPSNWELSAARALVVVRLLTDLYGVPPSHIWATAYGEHRPVGDNGSPEGRAKNRRVEVVLQHNTAKWRWY